MIALTNVIGFESVAINPRLDLGTGSTAQRGAHTAPEFLGRIRGHLKMSLLTEEDDHG